MIDALVAELKVEQEVDEKKKEYCAVEFDTSQLRTLFEHEGGVLCML